jgi:hypothetical protein
MAVTVVIPRAGSSLAETVATGSAVVKSIHHNEDDGNVHVYFEGNVYGATNLHRFADKLQSATSRMLTRYPTVACKIVPKDDVIAIGTFDEVTGQFHVLDDAARKLLVQWLGGELDEAELRTTATRDRLIRRG